MKSQHSRFIRQTTRGLFCALWAVLWGCGGGAVTTDLGVDSKETEVVVPIDGGGGTTCKEYCAVVMEACTGENQHYEDDFECRAYCQSIGVWDGGDGDDFEQNNTGCRKVYAEMALEGDADLHCKAASPLGGDVCGTWCDNYCNLMTRHCVAEAEVYEDEDSCREACAQFVDFGAINETPNNTLQCRLRYLEEIPFTPELHCSTAGPSGSPDCLPMDACTQYCETVKSNCTGFLQQYENPEICMDTCLSSVFWLPGSPGDTSGNSRECRFGQVLLTDGPEKDVHCLASGPSGGDICGSWCAVMCHLEEVNCIGGNSVYDSNTECIESCSSLQIGTPTDPPNSNSVQCRIEYLGSPSLGDPATNCAAAAVDGGGLCSGGQSNQCALYCDKVMNHCVAEEAQYKSYDECLSYCVSAAQWPAGGPQDLEGNTLGCRAHRAELAQHSPAEHCAAAGPSGGNLCGSWCEALCDLHQNNCSGDTAVYPDKAECLSSCATLSSEGPIGAETGNSVQCRIHFLGIPAYEKPEEFCSAAAVDSVGPCTGSIVQPCPEYCDALLSACSGDLFAFGSGSECVDYCQNVGLWPEGSSGELANTRSCRLDQVQLAAIQTDSAKASSCLAAGPLGNDLCGSFCDNYCHLVLNHCVQENLLFADEDNCLEFCAVFPDVGGPEDLTGDSLQCRLNHAMQAHLSPAESCAAASFLGGGVCVAP